MPHSLYGPFLYAKEKGNALRELILGLRPFELPRPY